MSAVHPVHCACLHLLAMPVSCRAMRTMHISWSVWLPSVSHLQELKSMVADDAVFKADGVIYTSDTQGGC